MSRSVILSACWLVMMTLSLPGDRCSLAFDMCMNYTFFRELELGIPHFGTLDLDENVCADWTDTAGANQFLDTTQELFLFGQQSELPSVAKPLLYLRTYPKEEVRYNITWSAFHPADVDAGLALLYQKSPWAGTVGPEQYLNLSLAFSCSAYNDKAVSQVFLVYNITTTNTSDIGTSPTPVRFHLFFQFLCNNRSNINRQFFVDVPVVQPLVSFSSSHLHLAELRIAVGVLALLVAVTTLGFLYFECFLRPRLLARYKEESSSKDAGVGPNEEAMSVASVPFEGYQLQSDDIILGGEIGKGAFGVVYEGYLRGERVAVKTLKCGDGISDKQIHRFLEEAHAMAQFQHPNVLNLVGICLEHASPQIVVPYMQNGDLHSYLKLFNPTFLAGAQELRFEQLFDFALQVALGMAYLGKRNFVHRDLAARNCMLNSDMVVKVGDFGLGRDVQDESYYKVSTEFMLPVKWMALESLQHYKFTTQSDVWSYGVVLWELLSLGQVPYAGVANHQVMEHLSEGNRLAQPRNCPDQMYSLMLNCWASDAMDRPLFSQILAALRSIDQSTYDLVLSKSLYIQHKPECVDLTSDNSEMSFPLNRFPPLARGSSSIGGSEVSTPMVDASQAQARTLHALQPAASSTTAANFEVVVKPPVEDEAAKTY